MTYEDVACHDTSFPTSVSQLTFANNFNVDGDTESTPADNHASIYKTLQSLRKSTLSISNRLRSILQDSQFISSVVANHGEYSSFPVIANERCGSWYISPTLKAGSAYFKSTDGHYGQWSLSLRRLNLTLLDVLGEHGGAVLVDSTRRGKALPDALRRTVPIWATVWNRILFDDTCHEDDRPSGHAEQASWTKGRFQSCGLEKSEVRQIELRMTEWVKGLLSLGLDLDTLRRKLKKPIRCVWMANEEGEILPDDWSIVHSSGNGEGGDVEEWNTLILCSASRRVVGAEMSEDGYIQGAGDDSEGWSCGLTASVFWSHVDLLLHTPESELPDLIERLVAEEKAQSSVIEAVQIHPTTNLYLAAGHMEQAAQASNEYSLTIFCQGQSVSSSPKLCILACRSGKLGSKDLRDKLDNTIGDVERVVRKDHDAKILVVCETGKDLSVGVLTALLCRVFDDSGQFRVSGSHVEIDKQLIKKRLAWVTSCKPDANPSRATLQAINSVLIDRPL